MLRFAANPCGTRISMRHLMKQVLLIHVASAHPHTKVTHLAVKLKYKNIVMYKVYAALEFVQTNKSVLTVYGKIDFGGLRKRRESRI